MFDDALASRAVVVVNRVAEAHIGRSFTRSELNSAHRHAGNYTRHANVQNLHIRDRVADGRGARLLILARAALDLSLEQKPGRLQGVHRRKRNG